MAYFRANRVLHPSGFKKDYPSFSLPNMPMKRIIPILLVTACFTQAQLQSAFIQTEKPKTTGLFNGKDIDHWKANFADGWEIQSGTLTPTEKQKKNNYLWTDKTYGDFILTLQYKLSEGTNSGVFIRTDPSDPVQKGIEIQLLDGVSKHATHGELDKHSNGALLDCCRIRNC